MLKAWMAGALLGMMAMATPAGAGVTPQLTGTTLLRADGTVWSWATGGRNGNGTDEPAPLPVRLTTLDRLRGVDDRSAGRLAVT